MSFITVSDDLCFLAAFFDLFVGKYVGFSGRLNS